MAGNIPPLVSSTPPPLNAFDDDEEEEEDEFGLYTTAEDSEYNDCISFKEKDEDKQHVPKSRGEQDNASQDSATDSGLCPDSEGMSPIPHSDEEKVLKQNSCDKLCQNVNGQPHACVSELSGSQNTALVYQETVPCPNLLNGHAKEDHCGQESDDDFGNFEFAPSHKLQTTVKESCGDGIKRCLSPTSQYVEKEHLADSSSNHSHSEQYSTKTDVSDKAFSGVCELDSNENGLLVMGPDNIHAIKNNCKYEEYKELAVENLEIDIASSNDSSSFNSVDSSLEPKVAIPSQSLQIEQHDIESMDKKAIETHEDCFNYAMDHQRSEKENQIEDKNSDNDDDDDDDFNDFADFKGEIPDSDDLSGSVNGDQLNKHSKMLPVVEQTKLGESSFSLPTFHQEESDEEFSNFADFSSADCAFVSAQSSDSLENTSHIPLTLDSDLRTESEFQDWVSVFPCGDEDTPLVATALLRQDDVVWSRLFPLESSPALSYQWNESLANRRLLTALNIDSRNILLTPWSISAVPRFAANLSCGPLEPIKASEPLQPQPSHSTSSAAVVVAATQESVPDAHFDWVGSGLTNPLDCPKTVLNLPKILSAEAENILNSLPDISFMRKTYIDFPIGDA